MVFLLFLECFEVKLFIKPKRGGTQLIWVMEKLVSMIGSKGGGGLGVLSSTEGGQEVALTKHLTEHTKC